MTPAPKRITDQVPAPPMPCTVPHRSPLPARSPYQPPLHRTMRSHAATRGGYASFHEKATRFHEVRCLPKGKGQRAEPSPLSLLRSLSLLSCALDRLGALCRLYGLFGLERRVAVSRAKSSGQEAGENAPSAEGPTLCAMRHAQRSLPYALDHKATSRHA